MGRKAKLKKIRKIAQDLPHLEVIQVQKNNLTGAELKALGVNKVDGKPVDDNVVYGRKEQVNIPMNHERNMKRMYNQFGMSGIDKYVNAANQHVKEQETRQEGLIDKV